MFLKFSFLLIIMLCSHSTAKALDVEVDGKTATVTTVDNDTFKMIQLSEKSGFSDSYCVVVSMMQGPISKVFVALVLVMTGIGGYIGRLQLGTIVAIVVGTLIIFTGTNMIDILLPRFGLSTGCKCKRYVIYGRGDLNPNTGDYKYIAVDTALNDNCSCIKSDCSKL